MRILVVGTPRSGTTWVGSALGMAADAGYLHEPDGIESRPYVMKAFRGLGGSPVLEPGDQAPPAYTRLWDAAFGARVRCFPGQQRVARALYERTTGDERRAALDATDPHETAAIRLVNALAVPLHLKPRVEHRVVKSVRLSYALEWVVARWEPSVVVCFRHPLDVVASALDLQWDVRPDLKLQLDVWPELRRRSAAYRVEVPDPDDVAAFTSWWVGLQMSALDDAVRRHPEFHVIDHAVMCSDPLGEFRRLVDAIGLAWTPSVEEYIVASDRPGSGYRVNRVASEQSERWRQRLSAADARAAARVLVRFPISQRYAIADVAG